MQYAASVGMHTWVRPTEAQQLARMMARQSARHLPVVRHDTSNVDRISIPTERREKRQMTDRNEPENEPEITEEEFSALLEASSLGAPHVRAVTEAFECSEDWSE